MYVLHLRKPLPTYRGVFKEGKRGHIPPKDYEEQFPPPDFFTGKEKIEGKKGGQRENDERKRRKKGKKKNLLSPFHI